jgi:RNA polymerase primary sigma factor
VEAVPSESETAALCRRVRQGIQAQQALQEGAGRFGRRDRDRLERIVNAGRWAEATLLRKHARLVSYLVAKVSRELPGARVEADDALQAGSLGFLEAIRRFDPDRGVRLSTFAAYYVRELVLRLHRDAPMLSGAYGGDLFVGLKRYAEYLETSLGRPPTPEELSQLWNQAIVARYSVIESGKPGGQGLSEEQLEEKATRIVRNRGLWLGPDRVAQIMGRSQVPISLEASTYETDGKTSIAETVTTGRSAEDDIVDAEYQASLEKACATVLQHLASISENMASVVIWFFGLQNNPPLPIPLIAETLGVSAGEVKRMLDQALEMMASYKELREMIGLGSAAPS